MNAISLKLGVSSCSTRRSNKAKPTVGLWKRISFFALAITVVASGFTVPTQAAPGDLVWQATSAKAGSSRQWSWSDSSADGSKLISATLGKYVYTSSDSGSTWTEHASLGERAWTAAAMSDDGTKLAIAEWAGPVYTSVDSGVTWTLQSGADSRYWQSLAMSSDGGTVVASAVGGYILTSSDSGNTWTQRTNAGSREWRGVDVSADGSKIIAVNDGGYIYVSDDSGGTWSEKTSPGARAWKKAAISADGTQLVAVAHASDIYTSADSGATWIQQVGSGARTWTSVSMSQDGSVLAAVPATGNVYTSLDYGVTWTARTALGSRNWVRIVVSADGLKLVASEDYGSMHSSADAGATWSQLTVEGSKAWWYSIASSANGARLLATANNNGYMYTSSDSGATWSRLTTAGIKYWDSVAVSANGAVLAGVVSTGYIYLSYDAGVTWSEQTGAGSRNWQSVALSEDGSRIVGAVYNGNIYRSQDSGATWSALPAAGTRQWISVKSSADGTKLIAGVNRGMLYYSSDSGATWTAVDTLNNLGGWYGLAINQSGTTMVAVDAYGPDYDGGYVYVSHDSGLTWQQQSLGLRYWNDWTSTTASVSADGQAIIIGDPYGSDWNSWSGGYLYVSQDGGGSWNAQVSQGGQTWLGVTVAADGKSFFAAANGGLIYKATVEPAATTTFNLASLTGTFQTATSDTVKNSALSVTSETCYTLDQPSIRTLSADGLTVPDYNVSLLGGIGFNVNCTTNGGNADVAVALGAHYTNPSDLRIYKQLGTGPLVDITNQVTIANQDISGTTKTTLSYNLIDGGTLDEDGVANGTIVDPIYIGAVMGASSTTGGVLASTGVSVYVIIAAAVTLLMGAFIFWRRSLNAIR